MMQKYCKRTNVLEVFENIYTSLYMLIVLYVLIDGQWKSEKWNYQCKILSVSEIMFNDIKISLIIKDISYNNLKV